MMAAALAKGKTKIEIAAAEPQVQDTGKFLKAMGVKIEGVGTHTIEIEGTRKTSRSQFFNLPRPFGGRHFFYSFGLNWRRGESN